MAQKHKDVEFDVTAYGGEAKFFRTWDEAASFAVQAAILLGSATIDVVIWSETGARMYGGSAAVAQYHEDPEASVFERIIVKAESLGRVGRVP